MQFTTHNLPRTEGRAKRGSLFLLAQLLPVILVTVIFCLWDVPDSANDVLIHRWSQ